MRCTAGTPANRGAIYAKQRAPVNALLSDFTRSSGRPAAGGATKGKIADSAFEFVQEISNADHRPASNGRRSSTRPYDRCRLFGRQTSLDRATARRSRRSSRREPLLQKPKRGGGLRRRLDATPPRDPSDEPFSVRRTARPRIQRRLRSRVGKRDRSQRR
jgi:hypothetical protein